MSVVINTNTVIKTQTILYPPPSNTGLIFYVDGADRTSYPISSSKWYDLSPTQNTSSFIGNSVNVIPPFDPQYGGGIQYRGYSTAQNQFSAIGRVAELQPENVTVNIWFKVSGSNFNGNPVNIIFRTRLGGYVIQQNPNQTIQTTIFNSSASVPINSGDGSVFTRSTFSSSFNFNQVYNYTFSLGNNKFKTYINGTLVSEQPSFANFVVYNKDIVNGELFGDSYVAIGCDGDNFDRFFQGTVYNLQMYDRALSDTEVSNLFNNFNTLRGFNV